MASAVLESLGATALAGLALVELALVDGGEASATPTADGTDTELLVVLGESEGVTVAVC